MALRAVFQNDVLGSLILEKADPIGINELSQKVKRSSELEGIMYEIVLDLAFIKDGRDFMNRAYRSAGGVDAVVNVTLYDYNENARKWEFYYAGQANMNTWKLSEDQCKVQLEQTGVERRIINLKSTDVDLETLVSENGQALPAQNIKSVLYHNKKLFLQLVADQPQETVPFTFADIPDVKIGYFNFTFVPTIDEIKERFDYPLWPSELEPSSVSKYMILFNEACELDLVIKNRFQLNQIDPDVTVTDTMTFGVYLKYGTPGNYTTVTLVEQTIPDTQTNFTLNADYSDSLSFEKGDELYLFAKLDGTNHSLITLALLDWELTNYIGSESSQVNFSGLTTVPDNNAKTILFHEAAQRCCQYYTNQVDSFRSSLFGRTDIVLPDGSSPYAEDGKGGLTGITNGNNLRGRDKLIFANLDDLLEYANQCYCTGIGVEVIDGKVVVVLERKSHFYDKTTKILSLGKVPPFEVQVDPKRYANAIEYGYLTKVDVGQVNATDEFNTFRKHNIPIVNTKNVLKVGTKMITGGYQIEYQRRLAAVSDDGKYDDNNFCIVLVRDGDEFNSKKDEGYSSITGVIDPASGYNFDISPGRCLNDIEGWKTYLASMLIRSSSKILKFGKGEVNYSMTTQKTTESTPIAEDGNVDLTGVEPIWDPELYPLKEVPFTREQMKLVKATPYGYIDFEDRLGNVFEGFIEEIDHDPNNKIADLLLLKVHRP